MKSLVLTEPGKLEVVVNEEKDVTHDQVKVRIARASVTSSDLSAYKGKSNFYPIMPSRIAMGLVSESSDFTLKTGQRVMLSPYRKSGGTLQVSGVDKNGYLADYVICPLSEVYAIPEGITDESVVFIEDVALAENIIEKLDVGKTQYILLNGCSSLNYIVGQLAIYYQAIPVIIDKNQELLDLAQDLGIYYTVNPNEENVFQKIKEITSGKMCDYMVLDLDSYPSAEGLLSCMREGGKLCLAGLDKKTEELSADLAPVFIKGLEIFGLNNGDGEIETGINMIATEVVKVDKLVERIADISEAPDVFATLAKEPPHALKTIIKC